MGSSSKPQTTTQTQNVEPWSAQQPYLQDLFKQADRWYYGANPIYENGSNPMQAGLKAGYNGTTAKTGTSSFTGASPDGLDEYRMSLRNPYDPGMIRTINPLTGAWANPIYPGENGYNISGTTSGAEGDTYTGSRSGTRMPDPNAAPQYFPGSTVVGFSPETEQALRMRAATATGTGGLLGGAENEVMKTLRGDYLDPNSAQYQWGGGLAGAERDKTLRGEYLQPNNPVYRGLMEGISYDLAPQIAGNFMAAGRTNRSPLAAEAFGRGITQGMLPYLENERSRMLGTSQNQIGLLASALQAERGRQSGAAPQAAQLADYRSQLLADVGQQRENLSRQYLQDQIDRWNFAQNAPLERLKQYGGLISGNYGQSGTSSVTQPVYSNPLMQGLGAAATVGSLFAGPGGAGALAPMAAKASVICTVLRECGLASDAELAATTAFGRKHPAVHAGYHVWAKHVAARMRRDSGYRTRVARLALPVIRQIAAGRWASPLGVVVGVGVAACWVLGKATRVANVCLRRAAFFLDEPVTAGE